MIAEYGSYPDSARARVTPLFEAAPKPEHKAAIQGNVVLLESSPGFEPAGSCARWTDGYYAVRFMCSGAFNGMRYKHDAEGLAKAHAHFQRITQAQS